MPDQQWHPKANPWLIALAVIVPTFMELLDTSIASVALPHIAGNLSASTDEATWVVTSYLVTNAIVLPASSWFALRFGRRRFLLFCIVGPLSFPWAAGQAPPRPTKPTSSRWPCQISRRTRIRGIVEPYINRRLSCFTNCSQ